jgi:2-desacetyl-2-hydroxyethyl bacteriochlorophyllide A dehydrogenase
MKTLVCLEPKKMVFCQRPIPTPQSHEAQLKIKTVGICGTDIHAWAGNQPFFSYPRVLGHEICGVVSEIGSAVTTLKIGQRVAVMPYLSCGRCGACQSGRTNCCENISVIGVHQDGGFCEYLNVPESNLIAVDDVDPVAAALIEPFAISAHAVRRAKVKPNDSVLVVGAGPIGLGVAAIAKADGAKVIVADTSEERRRHVEKELGVCALDAAASDFEQRLRDQFDGKLAQTVIDATGNQRAMNNAVNLIRHGGTIVFVGLFKGDLTISDPEFHKKETTMMGSRNATLEDFEKVGRLMSQGKLAAAMMLSHRFPFADLDRRYEQDVINNTSLLKGVIEF